MKVEVDTAAGRTDFDSAFKEMIQTEISKLECLIWVAQGVIETVGRDPKDVLRVRAEAAARRQRENRFPPLPDGL